MPRSGLALVVLFACDPTQPPPPASTPAEPVSELDRVVITDWAPGQLPIVPRTPITELERETRSGRFLYTAEVELTGGTPPDLVVARLHATNTGRRPAYLFVRGCNALHLLAYPRGDRSSGPAWNSSTVCNQPASTVSIAARATHTVEATYPASDVLAAIGQGRHEFVVSLPGDGSVEAGALTYDAGLADLRYRTTTAIETGDTLALTIDLRNDGPRPLKLALGTCHPLLRAYTNGARTAPPPLRTEDIDPSCPYASVTAELAPGAVLAHTQHPQLTLRFPLQKLLAYLPTARYYFTLQLDLNYVPVDIIAGEAVLVRTPEFKERLGPH